MQAFQADGMIFGRRASRRWAGGLASLVFLGLAPALGQAPAAPVPAAAAENPAVPRSGPIAQAPVDFTADRVEYIQEGGVLSGTGHVEIRYGGHLLKCDSAQYSEATGEVIAQGNVQFTRANGATWTGQRLIYNVKTDEGDFGAFAMYSDPYRVHAGESKMISRDRIDLKNIMITTCEDGVRECYVRAAQGTLRDQRYVEMWNASVWLGPVPVLYFPYYRKDLKSAGRWDFIPGYRSNLGAYLLTSYNYPITDNHSLRGATVLHLYSERGAGLEQNFRWIQPTNHLWQGFANAVWINDTKLYKDDEEKLRREALLDDSNRYRVRFEHTQSVGDRGYFIGQGAVLSDPYFLEDFFREEYRAMPIPENRLAYTRRGDHYTASMLVNKRLNDFYANVDRLPELKLSIDPIEVGDTPLYYQGLNSASFLSRLEPEGSEREDYDAFRAHTEHTLSLPRRYFGFLSLIPSAGFQGTYYSKTLGPRQSVTNFVTVAPAPGSTNAVPEIREEITTVQEELGADLRRRYEFGLESSFKAYKVLEEGETLWGSGIRHVAEPFAIYTYAPEPNLTPDLLYQFDDLDRLDETHTLRLGMRNKLQTRVRRPVYFYRPQFGRGELADTTDTQRTTVVQERPVLEIEEVARPDRPLTVHDLLDIEVYTTYRIKKDDPTQNDFGPVVADLELRPSRWLKLDWDMAYDLDTSKLAYMNTQLGLLVGDGTSIVLEHLYRPDSRNLVTAELRLLPKARWSFGTYHRYSLEDSRMEEHNYFVQRRMKCVGWGIGLRHDPATDAGEDDDFTAWVQFWLLALPNMGIYNN